jgi:RHS repeat-associated protein
MVSSVTPAPEQQHMPRAQARAGGQDAHVRLDFVAYIDSSTSTISFTKPTPARAYVEDRNRADEYCCNQQFSITSITNSTGAISERYAYTAYGQPTILDASGSILSASTISNRYTYTGREWDATLGLHHFRARWMSPSAGRFLGRDPIGYGDGTSLFHFGINLSSLDPEGLAELDADPSSSDGVPWCYHQFPSSPGKTIQGDTENWLTHTKVVCRCVCCEDGCSDGADKKGPLCTVIVRLTIRINTHRSWDEKLVYGHEQYHVDNFIEAAKAIQGRLTAREENICTSQDNCSEMATELEREANAWLEAAWKEEHEHKKPHPIDGRPYLPKYPMPEKRQPFCAPPSEPKPFIEPKECISRPDPDKWNWPKGRPRFVKPVQ